MFCLLSSYSLSHGREPKSERAYTRRMRNKEMRKKTSAETESETETETGRQRDDAAHAAQLITEMHEIL